MAKKERVCSCCSSTRIKVYKLACDCWGDGYAYVVRCSECGSAGLVRETDAEAWKSFDKVNKALVARVARIRKREEEAKAAADELQKQKRERKRK